MTTQPEKSLDFYSKLFGWTWEKDTQENPYYFAHAGDKAVCGLTKTEACKETGATSFWSTYFYSNDIDASLKTVQDQGGSVINGKTQSHTYGSFATVKDPTGAFFNFWNSTETPEAAYIQKSPGHACWTELMTSSIDRAGQFYGNTFSWTPEKMETSPEFEGYLCMKAGDEMTAGMMEIKKEWGEMPSHWANSICVESCSATTQKAKELGAVVKADCINVPNVGTYSTIQDPNGAWISFVG